MSGTLMPAVPATFKAVKVLDGRPNGAWTDRDRYVADITALDGAPANAVPSTITFADNRTQTLQINSNAFAKEGVYRYQVRERKGDNPGVAYDSRTWILTVTVTDDLTTFTRRITANTTCDACNPTPSSSRTRIRRSRSACNSVRIRHSTTPTIQASNCKPDNTSSHASRTRQAVRLER